MAEETLTFNLEFVPDSNRVTQAVAATASVERNLKRVEAQANTTQTRLERMASAFDRMEAGGLKLMRAGMGLRQLGDIFGDETLSKIGTMIGSVGALANSLGDLKDALINIGKVNIPGLGPLGTAGGAVATAAIVKGVEDYQRAQASWDAVAAQQRINTRLQSMNPADRAVYEKKYADSLNAAGILPEAKIAAIRQFDELLQQIGKDLAPIEVAFEKLYGSLPGLLGDLSKQAERVAAAAKEQAARNAAAYAEAGRDQQRRLIAQYHDANVDLFKSQQDYSTKIVALDRDLKADRLAAAQDLARDLAAMEADYYANRAATAEQYGLDAQRAEEDHQRNMRRLQQGHDQRVRKLAEQRDALGLEDELQAYEEERQAAEEDYAVEARRRNEDYARQMRDLEVAFQQQRYARLTDYNAQVVELQTHYNTQLSLTRQLFDAIEAEIRTRINRAQQGIYGEDDPNRRVGGPIGDGYDNLTSARANSVNQSNAVTVSQTFGAASAAPEVYQRIVYETMVDVFNRVRM